MSEHEDRALCDELRDIETTALHWNAADRLDDLHAQRADLIDRLTAAEAERDTYRCIIDRDRRSFARLVADLPPTPEPEQGEE